MTFAHSRSPMIDLVSLVIVGDKEKAEKLKQSLPPGLNVKEIKAKSKSA